MNLLLVEDDQAIAGFIRRGIEGAGHVLDWTIEGLGALDYASTYEYDGVILDLMLPDADGVDICARLRQLRWSLPILILSARDEVCDRIAGLQAGADDFLVKPFAFDELLARLHAIQRRTTPEKQEATSSGGQIVLDREARSVRHADHVVSVTVREFQLLDYLLRHKNKVVSRTTILNSVWGADADICDNSVDVYVGYLRRKLELGKHLKTIRGVGFMLTLD